MKQFFNKILQYSAGNFFNKFLLLALLPIYTRAMAPAEYAVYTNLIIFVSIAYLVYVLGIQQSLFSYFHHKKTADYKYSLISSVFILLTFIGMIFSSLIIIFKVELAVLLTRDISQQNLFYYIAIILLFDVINGISLAILNIMEKSKEYVSLSIVKNTVLVILVLIAKFTDNLSVKNLFFYITISAGITAIFSIFKMVKVQFNLAKKIENKIIFSAEIISNLLRFGLPMIPGTLAMLLLRAGDRYMLTYFSENTLYDTGIYAVGYRIGMIMIFLNSIVSLVYFPYAMRIADNKDAKKSYRKIFNFYILLGGILGSLIILFASEIFYIFIDKAYYGAIKIVFFGVISNYLLGIFNIINLSFYVKKKAGNIAVAVIIGAILNIGLNYLLIPKFGLLGAGWASIIAYLFTVMMNYYYAEKIHKVGYNFVYFALGLLTLFGFAFLNLRLTQNMFLLKLAATLIFMITIILLKKNEIRRMFNGIQN
ncbi:MAG: oligosaccharide flippase family protein [Candidatus Cloacimonetes bacterium]|jgi:O-antigen/teichoic acid export membrane protein|nr:oligosaccharide flippase family protein [Candidatus Cloacimonadota bacterium]MBT7469122.1 oligosaccharide flippase family protein [Candidatus Cloacimonadota bacterium]